MKRFISGIICLSLFVICISGCDFIRTLAGRPTSGDIEAKRSQIKADLDRKAAEKDSADAVLRKQMLQAASLDSLKASGCTFINVSDVRVRIMSELKSKYYIVCGAFADKSNAERMAAKLLENGCNSELIPYKNGSTAVGASPSDDISEIYGQFVALHQGKLIPEDSWILVNE